jgi:Na+-translocating ferredoxin:NAD+ oxidoreductase subunit B
LAPADSTHDLTEALDALLPQTQCGLCGYSGCRPYADAIADGKADINRCPPGGSEVIDDLASLLGRAPKPLDTSRGNTQAPAAAVIDESWCIGCTLCLQACPVDAIAGAAKVMHTVIADECTGCELCIPPCPVDCIQMVPVERSSDRTARLARGAHARNRYRAKQQRVVIEKTKPKLAQSAGIQTGESKKSFAIARALARAKNRIQP